MKATPATNDRMLPFAVAGVSALGVVMLGMGQRDLRLAFAALLAIAASLVLTDVKGWVRLNRTVANIAALAAVAISVRDFMRFDSDTQLLAIANLLIYLQIVLLFQEKFLRVYWQILVLSLLEVVIGAALNLGAMFGVLLVLYMFVTLVAVMLLYLRRESQQSSAGGEHFYPMLRGGQRAAAQLSAGRLERDEITVIRSRADGARALSPWGVLRETVAASLTILLVTAVLFFSVPRFGSSMWRPAAISFQPAVGFTGTVSLGTLGAAADNPEEVMQVAFRREHDPLQPYVVRGDPLFRGSILTHYARGEWQYHARDRGTQDLGPKPPTADAVLQRITIEPLDEPVLFGVYPFYRVRSERAVAHVTYDLARRQYVRSEQVQGDSFDFETLTTGFQHGRQQAITAEHRLRSDAERIQLLQLPYTNGAQHPEKGIEFSRQRRDDALAIDELPELAAAAERRIERAELTRDEPYFAYQAARTLEQYLRSPRFRYSLEPQPRDSAIDPVEDFIKNNPSGHCEYFASALALMLRTQGIPARVVVGFKGGDFNQVGGFYQVRQLHAHAWVEAYLDLDEIPPDVRPPGFPAANAAGWLMLDPTPAADESWAFDSGLLNIIADLGDYLKHLWSNYVVGLNAERQRDAIYRPLAQLAWNAELIAGRESLAAVVWRWLEANVLTFRGAMIVLAVSIATLWVGRRLAQLGVAAYHRWKRSRHKGKRRQRVEFYERFERILAEHGLRRARQQTPLEFALAAGAEMVAGSETRRFSAHALASSSLCGTVG